jgi:branched-chain amino acid transport system permease protein
MGAAGLIAIPIGLPVLRLNDIYLAIATIGFGEIMVVLARNFDRIYFEIFDKRETITGGATGIKGIPVTTTTEHLLIFLLIAAYFMYRMHRSRFGRALVAIRQDPSVAANLGIHVVYYKNMAFIIGAMIAGGAGGLSGHMTRVITPETYGFNQAVDILTYAVLGGTLTFVGPIVGGMALAYLPELLRRVDFIDAVSRITGENLTQQESAVRGIITGIVLILVIEFLPGGMANPVFFGRLWAKLKARLGQGPDDGNDSPPTPAEPVAEDA